MLKSNITLIKVNIISSFVSSKLINIISNCCILQEELKKIEDEMRLAEETLQKELQEHELKIKQLNEQLLIEKKLHEDEVKRLEEEKQRKKNLSAAKIQAHFRGMRWVDLISTVDLFQIQTRRI